MQINTKTMLVYYSMAACTVANHILHLLQMHNIPHTHNEAEGSVTVDIQVDRALKTLIFSIDAKKLAESNFQNPPICYIALVYQVIHNISCYLESLDDEPVDIYLELDFIDVDTATKHIQTK